MDTFSELHRETKELMLLSAGLFFTLFLAVQVYPEFGFYTRYASTTIILVYLSWQLGRLIRRRYPGKRVSSANKAVLITGCDTGFGHATARELFREGYTVFATCLFPDGEGAQSLRNDHSSERMHVFGMDVTKDEDVQQALHLVKAKLTESKKELWAVVNNAGIGFVSLVGLCGMDHFEKQIAVNQVGVIRVTKAFLPLLRQSRGRTIFLASVAVMTLFLGRLCCPFIVAYSMTKHAIIAFADGLRRELMNSGIKFITVEPTGYRTNIIPHPDIICSDVEKLWKESDPEVLELYGQDKFEIIVEIISKAFKRTNPNLSEVVKAINDAISLEEPEISIRVCLPSERILLWLSDFMPTRLQDTALKIWGSR